MCYYHIHLYIWFKYTPEPFLVYTSRLRSYRGNMLLHPSCCCYDSISCLSSILSATTCHDIVLVTLHAQGIAPLCIASELALLLRIDMPIYVFLSVALAMTFHPWLTKSSSFTRRCVLVPLCCCHRLLMKLRYCPMRL